MLTIRKVPKPTLAVIRVGQSKTQPALCQNWIAGRESFVGASFYDVVVQQELVERTTENGLAVENCAGRTADGKEPSEVCGTAYPGSRRFAVIVLQLPAQPTRRFQS